MIRAEEVPNYTLTIWEFSGGHGAGAKLREQQIHDPFIRTTIRPRGCRAAWAVLRGRLEWCVQVGGSPAAFRAVFQSDYTPAPAGLSEGAATGERP